MKYPKKRAAEKMIQLPMYLTREQKRGLDALWRSTRIQRAVLVREAIDDLLVKYRKVLKKGGAK